MQIYIRGRYPQEGGRQSREMQKSVHGMESDEERKVGTTQVPTKDNRGQRSEVGVVGGGARQGPGRDSRRRAPRPTGKGRQGDPDREEREKRKKEKRVISRPGRHP